MQGKVPLIVGLLAVVLLAGAAWFLAGGGGPNTNVLDVADPTDEQIADIVALLLAKDQKIVARADAKVRGLKDRALPALEAFAQEGFRQTGTAFPLVVDLSRNRAFTLAEQLLQHEKQAVRATIVSALQTLGPDRRAVELWIKALGDAEADVREEAVQHLGGAAGFRAIAVAGLNTLRTDPSSDVREAAAFAIRRLTGRDVTAQFKVD